MQYRDTDISSRPVRVTRPRRGDTLDTGNGEVEWADEESDLDPSYDPDGSDDSDDSDASDASDASDESDASDTSGITLGSQDTESDASDDSDDSDLSGFIVDDDCIEFYSTDDPGSE